MHTCQIRLTSDKVVEFLAELMAVVCTRWISQSGIESPLSRVVLVLLVEARNETAMTFAGILVVFTGSANRTRTDFDRLAGLGGGWSEVPLVLQIATPRCTWVPVMFKRGTEPPAPVLLVSLPRIPPFYLAHSQFMTLLMRSVSFFCTLPSSLRELQTTTSVCDICDILYYTYYYYTYSRIDSRHYYIESTPL